MLKLNRHPTIYPVFAALIFSASACSSDSELQLEKSGTPQLTWTLTALDGTPLSGELLVKYVTTGSKDHCKYVPKAFGLFPQTGPIRREARHTLLPEKTNPATVNFSVPAAIQGECGWELQQVFPKLAVNGMSISLSDKQPSLSAGLSSGEARYVCTKRPSKAAADKSGSSLFCRNEGAVANGRLQQHELSTHSFQLIVNIRK